MSLPDSADEMSLLVNECAALRAEVGHLRIQMVYILDQAKHLPGSAKHGAHAYAICELARRAIYGASE